MLVEMTIKGLCALQELDRLVVPAQRSELHEAGVAALFRWRDALRELVDIASRADLTALEAETAYSAYQVALSEVRDLSREMQELRMRMPQD